MLKPINFFLILILLVISNCGQIRPAVEKPQVVKEEKEAEQIYLSALKAYNERNFQKSAKYSEQLLKQFPEAKRTGDAQYLLAGSYYALKQYPQAIAEAEKLIQKFPQSVYLDEGWTILGNVYYQNKEYEKSVSAYLNALKQSKNEERKSKLKQSLKKLIEDKLGLKELQTLKGNFPKSEVEEEILFNLGKKEFLAKHFKEAGETLNEFLAYYPQSGYVPEAKKILTSKELEKLLTTSARKIGLIAPLSEKYAMYGQAVKEGVEIALEEYKAKGEELSLESIDTEGDPIKALKATQKLIEEEKVLAIVGDVVSMPTIAAAGVANSLGTPLISPTASEERISSIGPYIFQLQKNDEVEAEKIAEYAVKKLSISIFAILYSKDSAGEAMKKAFEEKATKLGGKIVISESYEPGTTDFKTSILKIQEKEPLALFVPCSPEEIAMIAPQLVLHKLKVQILGPGSWHSEKTIQKGEEYIEGVIFAAPLPNKIEKPEIQNFIDNYKKKFKKEPSRMAAQGYDAMKILLQVMERGVDSRDKLKERLSKIKVFSGISGNLYLSKEKTSGEESNFAIFTIKNKQIVEIE
ncbi:MAG: penicillin-binding protein activator [Candidatus Edwardsbacteria bacterium]